MSSATPTVRDAFRQAVRRAVKSWNDFFFTPRDPTTLGLMRLCAGIFILYVHLVHTWDLYNLFGPDGWAEAPMVEDLRKNMPFQNPPTTEWEPWYNIVPPMDRQVRETFLLDWVQNLPTDAKQRRQVLLYLENLPLLDQQKDSEGLAYAEQLVIRQKLDTSSRATSSNYRLAEPHERQKLLDALTHEKLDATDLQLIPQHMHDWTLDQRQEARREVEAFIATLPKNPGDVAKIMLHLQFQALNPIRSLRPNDPRSELQRTLMFLTQEEDPNHADPHGPYLPNDEAKRREVLQYIARWNLDPRRTYGTGRYIWSAYFHVTDRDTMALVHVFFLVAMALFAAGLWTRITSVITWLGVLSYVNRNDLMVFGMDTMMNIACLYLMVGPSGAALSLDRWLEKRRAARELEKARREKRDTSEYEAILAGPRPSILAGFVTRLVQIHFCFIYAASGLAKLKGPAWWNHSAIWRTIVNPEFSPTVFQPYMWLMMQLSGMRWLAEIVMSIGAAYTLFLEIGFPFLVWRPTLRPFMLMAAILLHTGIAVFMGLTVFGLFMLVLLMAFIPPETVKRWLEVGDRKIRESVSGRQPAPSPAPVKV
jgi:hypothetical protein